MEINNVTTFGWENAFRGMRYPFNSHKRADSFWAIKSYADCMDDLDRVSELYAEKYHLTDAQEIEVWNWLSRNCVLDKPLCPLNDREDCMIGIIGPNDLDLARRLNDGGAPHDKFLRQIHVQADIDMPRYWWSEADTYKVATTANSESTMHKLLNKKSSIVREDFLISEEDEDIAEVVIGRLEELRVEFMSGTLSEQEKLRLLVRAKRILPEGFLQCRTWDGSYATVKQMIHWRENHRLKEEWGFFCDTMLQLPYMKYFMGKERLPFLNREERG